MSLWVICKSLGLFVNPLTADDKYSLLNRGHLLQHFQMPLSQKRKIFSQFHFTFYNFRYNFQHFQKKHEPHSWCVFELTNFDNWRTFRSWPTTPLRYLFIPASAIQVQKVSRSDMQNLRTVCYSIDRRWQVLSS